MCSVLEGAASKGSKTSGSYSRAKVPLTLKETELRSNFVKKKGEISDIQKKNLFPECTVVLKTS